MYNGKFKEKTERITEDTMSRRILVVDDDAMNLRMAEFILKQKEYEVLKADSGMKCLDILKSGKVDLVLLDIEMPVMSGIETLEKIRADKEFAKLPVMFLSASADDDTLEEADKLGAVDYVKKPFMPQDLQARVAKVMD